jgi:prepilin-type N-terminal cleavage/methylation domain-containing protein
MRRTLGSALRREDGFTLIEILAASLILAIGIAALVTVLISSRHLVNDTERRAAATHVAEETIEDILAKPYGSIGLSSVPSGSTDPYSPDYYVSGSQYQPDQRPGGSTATEPLVTGGTLAPSTPWTDGRLSGVIHRYVTSTNVGSSSEVKRVTVAVTVTGGQRKIKPALVSSVVSP